MPDDLVICCRGRGELALAAMRDMMQRLKLTVNENKTRVCRLPEEKFDFLGYTYGRYYSPRTGRAYLGITPSKQRVQRVCAAVSEATRRSLTQRDIKTVVQALTDWQSDGPTTSASVLSAKPTERWIDIPAGGSASGWAPNTKRQV